MKIKLMLATIGGAVGNLMGGWDAMLKALIVLVLLDYLTGILAAMYNHKLSSDIGYKGIIKKVGIFAVVTVASLIDDSVGLELIRNITVVFYIANEGISILENVGNTGVKYPKKLKNILKQLREDNKK